MGTEPDTLAEEIEQSLAWTQNDDATDWKAECLRLRKLIRAMADTDARMVLLFQIGGRDGTLTVTSPVEPIPADLIEYIGAGFSKLICQFAEIDKAAAEGGTA
jgi:hypothetical protein